MGAILGTNRRFQKTFFLIVVGFLLAVVLALVKMTTVESSKPVSKTWQEKVSNIVWVAYSPTNADPTKGIEATPDSIRKDLVVLKGAGFTGLVTYGSEGILGRELPKIAQQEGFYMIMGIWNPLNSEEIGAVKANANNPIVLGICVGNEGIFQRRYSLSQLSTVIEQLHKKISKPIATSEPIDEYAFNKKLIQLGDWVYPNAHPIFHGKLEPIAAVEWTKQAYKSIKRRSGSDRFVMFKEVGLPTAGDSQNSLSEKSQEQYYLHLATKTDVPFTWFESFDQTWKNNPPFEQHWGLFRSDRTPKRLVSSLPWRNKSPSF